MKLTDGTYLCPFCLSSNICEGPHMKESEEFNFFEYMHYAKIDHLETVIEEIKKYQIKNNIDLSELSSIIQKRLAERDK